jgi:lipopolysaccharide/colanic/teichoic acid biosynthesis glycosyltransferase
MELKNGVYIGNETAFAESLICELKDINITVFPDSTENLDFFQSTDVNLVFLETSACAHNVEPYLLWLKQVIDLRKCIIILFAGANDKTNYNRLFVQGVNDIYRFPAEPRQVRKRVEILAELMDGREPELVNADEFIYKIPAAKRLFDIIIAGGALFLLSPIFIIIAALIKLESKGSVFYASKRIGTGFKVFDFYNFRSTHVNPDKIINETKIRNINNQHAEKEISFTGIKDDPGTTRIGRFIRNTGIDELPQLINVLKGDMSVVGNRPIPFGEAELLTTDHWIEGFNVPTGLTGLWQVEKRDKAYKMLTEERNMLNNEYIRAYTFRKDITIIFRTFQAILHAEKV